MGWEAEFIEKLTKTKQISLYVSRSRISKDNNVRLVEFWR